MDGLWIVACELVSLIWLLQALTAAAVGNEPFSFQLRYAFLRERMLELVQTLAAVAPLLSVAESSSREEMHDDVITAAHMCSELRGSWQDLLVGSMGIDTGSQAVLLNQSLACQSLACCTLNLAHDIANTGSDSKGEKHADHTLRIKLLES